MTRKDYQLIADVIKVERNASRGAAKLAVETVAASMAIALKRDNPRFDADRFLAACGIPETEINQ